MAEARWESDRVFHLQEPRLISECLDSSPLPDSCVTTVSLVHLCPLLLPLLLSRCLLVRLHHAGRCQRTEPGPWQGCRDVEFISSPAFNQKQLSPLSRRAPSVALYSNRTKPSSFLSLCFPHLSALPSLLLFALDALSLSPHTDVYSAFVSGGSASFLPPAGLWTDRSDPRPLWCLSLAASPEKNNTELSSS